MRNRLLGSATISLLVPGMFWLGGYDFDARGSVAVSCLGLYILFFLIVVACPLWNLEK